jgi:hypothetical protein
MFVPIREEQVNRVLYSKSFLQKDGEQMLMMCMRGPYKCFSIFVNS